MQNMNGETGTTAQRGAGFGYERRAVDGHGAWRAHALPGCRAGLSARQRARRRSRRPELLRRPAGWPCFCVVSCSLLLLLLLLWSNSVGSGRSQVGGSSRGGGKGT